MPATAMMIVVEGMMIWAIVSAESGALLSSDEPKDKVLP